MGDVWRRQHPCQRNQIASQIGKSPARVVTMWSRALALYFTIFVFCMLYGLDSKTTVLQWQSL